MDMQMIVNYVGKYQLISYVSIAVCFDYQDYLR